MTEKPSLQELSPSRGVFQEATHAALKKRVEPGEIERFIKEATSAGVPDPIGATASVELAVWGKVHCNPDGWPWKYDHTIWGGPAYFASAVGFMYTAYESWDAFFENVTSVHVQGGAATGGFLQINWFNKDAVPVGQFNGLAGGAGVCEAGGEGKWERT